MSNTKILITGGAGFIGGNFVHYILEKYPDYQVYNLDALTYAGELTKHHRWKNKRNYFFMEHNINDKKYIMDLFSTENFTYVVHFAAESHVDRSISNPSLFMNTNVLGTQYLLEAALRYPIKKFIYISTDEVYGDLDLFSKVIFTESSLIQPNNPYSASKAAADLLCHSYYNTYGLPINITRCSNNYGPYQFPEKLIPLTISRAICNKTIPIYGDGKNVRDWLHVYDHCTAIDLVLHQGEIGQVYNVGDHNERCSLEVVKKILSILNKENRLIEFVSDRPGHDRRYAIDASKLKALGWSPKYNFDNGIKHTVKWYMENQQWMKAVHINL